MTAALAQHARAPTTTEPRLSVAGRIDGDEALDEAIALLRRDGVVVIDDFVDPALIAQCRQEIEAAYPDLAKVDRERNYGPYEGRHCMPMCVEGALADRSIFLPRFAARFAVRLLGPTFLMDSLGLLVAIPGAPDQKRHPDGTLFPEMELDRMLPVFALSFAMPLVTMDETSGRTAFWRGSHRSPEMAEAPDYAPVVPPGSVIFWDFRTRHCGLANTGDRPRPVIFTVLSREWWVEMHPPEAIRYEKFLVSRAVRDGLDAKTRHRIHRATLVDRPD